MLAMFLCDRNNKEYNENDYQQNVDELIEDLCLQSKEIKNINSIIKINENIIKSKVNKPWSMKTIPEKEYKRIIGKVHNTYKEHYAFC